MAETPITSVAARILVSFILSPFDPEWAGDLPPLRLSTVLGAFNASNLASSYIERGNFTAARRKLVQALNAVNQLQSGLSSAGVQAKGGTA